MPGGKHVLGQSRDRHIFGTVKVGEKGQIVIPKEARTVFGIQPSALHGSPLSPDIESRYQSDIRRF